MRYENPDVPQDVNVSRTSPLVEFFRLLAAIGLICVILTAVVYFCARWIAPWIPFRYEGAAASFIVKRLDPPDPADQPMRDYLQTLADKLAASEQLPEGMSITVHLLHDKQLNAFATLGGHIVVTQGLLGAVENENSLAMVLAHEIAHVKHRDPIIAAGGGIVTGIVIASITGSGDFVNIGGTAAGLTQLSFSRSQEEAADETALTAVQAHYGHTAGADGFFRTVMQKQEKMASPPLFLSSHPATEARIGRIRTGAAGNEQAQPRPLPQFFLEWQQANRTPGQ